MGFCATDTGGTSLAARPNHAGHRDRSHLHRCLQLRSKKHGLQPTSQLSRHWCRQRLFFVRRTVAFLAMDLCRLYSRILSPQTHSFYKPFLFLKGLIYGLLLTITGLAGILASLRRSYSLIFTFFLFCLLSFLESIFLIIYYSILVNYYYRFQSNLQPSAEIWRSSQRPDSGDRSFGLVGTNLALSILALLLSFFTMLYAAFAGRICTHRKAFANFYGQPKFTAHPPPLMAQ